MISPAPQLWPSARQFAEAVQCPKICFSDRRLQDALPAFDRLGMPLVTSGQFAYVFKLKAEGSHRAFAVRCFRGFLGDRDERYRAINAHLRERRFPSLTGFDYDPEGIRVGARKFPTLVMEWINGPTLDVYIEEVLGRRDVLLHLADQWVRLVQALRERKMAHGDLQHGNIIVEEGRLRLVDVDGMYVPSMNGWEASEVGHQHYQHPLRNEKLFDEGLDNFSALAIYLSLMSLAEEPDLWAAHHDENLLFTRADFLDPSSSALFEKIRRIGTDHRQFAEMLARAAQSPPGGAPDLLAYVAPKSKLPSWMLAPADLAVVNRTREATKIEVPILEARTYGAKGRGSNAPVRAPVTPNSQQVQSVFSAAPQISLTPAPFSAPLGLNQLMPATFYHAKQMGKAWVPFIWVWLITGRHAYELLGASSGFAILLTAFTFPALCLLAGFGRATYHARDAIKSGARGGLSPAPTSVILRPVNSRMGTHGNASSAVSAAAGSITASRTQGIYHRDACDWAMKITPSNRIKFPSPVEAQAAGYRACRVCAP